MKTPHFIKSSALATSCLLTLQTAQAATIAADVLDAQAINTTGGTDYTLSVAAPSATSLRIGRYDDSTYAPNGSNGSAIFAFEIPDFGAIADPFTEANFTFNLATINSSWNVILEGLGTRSSADVINQDFRFGTTNGTTPAIALQSNILNSTSVTGSHTSSDIAGYLNTQYASGTNAGKYAFLRLAISTGANSSIFNNAQNGYTVTSANAGTGTPYISYSAVPEPSSTALLGLTALGVLFRRRRSEKIAS